MQQAMCQGKTALLVSVYFPEIGSDIALKWYMIVISEIEIFCVISVIFNLEL
jgi:hypothetical protein